MLVATQSRRKAGKTPSDGEPCSGSVRKSTEANRSAQRWREDPHVCLMLKAQEGDEDAFRELVDHYGPRVFGYFIRQVRNRAEAEDLTQEVFLRLYRFRDRYQP